MAMARSRIFRLDQVDQFTAVNLLSDPGAIGGPYVVPQCARINLIIDLESGKQAHIILVGRYAGGYQGSVAQANTLLAAFTSGAAWTTLATFLASSTGLNRVSVQDVNSPDQAVFVANPTSHAGTSASPAIPNEVSAVITKRTGLLGPANRGRMYFPGWATNALGAGNVIAAAAITALATWATSNVGSALSGSGYTHVIGQPARQAYVGTTGTAHPARAATSSVITTLEVRDNHWDSQRRRGLK